MLLVGPLWAWEVNGRLRTHGASGCAVASRSSPSEFVVEDSVPKFKNSCGCAVASRSSPSDFIIEDSVPKFKNSWFNHDNIVTCSRDGSAIIWVPTSRRSHGKVGRWVQAYHLKVPPPPMPPQPSRGGPRQRLLPTPRAVNMIMWSLDNRFVLAAIMENRICVWNANDGSLVHSLAGHTVLLMFRMSILFTQELL